MSASMRPLLAYAPWQAREAATRALVAPLIFAALASSMLLAFKAQTGITDFTSEDRALMLAQQVYANIGGLAIWMGGVLLMGQTIALDRDRQFYRFTFSAPVVPWRYYLQRFVLGLAVGVALYALVPLAYRQWVIPVPLGGALAAVALTGLLIGGLLALVSVFTRRDSLGTIIVYATVSVAQDLAKAGLVVDWLKPVVQALPPFSKYATLRAALLTDGSVIHAADVWHVALYGAGMLALALYLMRRLSLAR